MCCASAMEHFRPATLKLNELVWWVNGLVVVDEGSEEWLTDRDNDSTSAAGTVLDDWGAVASYVGVVPTMYPIGRSILAIPHTSCNVERSFSVWKHVRSEKQHNMKEGTHKAYVSFCFNGVVCVGACFLLMLRMQNQGLLELSWRSLHCCKQIQALATPMQRQCNVVQKGTTTIKCGQASHFPSFLPIFPHFPPFPLIFPHFPHFSVACWILRYSGYGYFLGLYWSQCQASRHHHLGLWGQCGVQGLLP